VSVVRDAAKSGIWFAGFKFATQAVSWGVTIVVARILSPADYGLMSLASILTGYIEVFSELGLGSAIVQREHITQKEYSSNFWFSLFVGCAFALVAFALSYPTAWIFNEPRVLPLTQMISVFFVIGAVNTIPLNILMRDLRFKAIGVIQLVSAAMSSAVMLWMALAGFGVSTLIGGTVVLRVSVTVLVFVATKWRPDFHFAWEDVRGFLKFGLNVAGARSLFFVFQKADVFVVGKVLGTEAVGFYAFAMQLASMPTDKIASIINQVSFPVFSRFQNDLAGIQNIYLKASKYLSILVSPLFLAGAVWGDEMIRAVLGETWVPVIFLFRVFCLAQLIVAITIVNSPVHTSMGRSHWVLWFYLAAVVLMPASVYIAAHYSLAAVAVPWLTVFPVLSLGWTAVTLKKLSIAPTDYVRSAGVHVLAALVVVASAKLLLTVLGQTPLATFDYRVLFGQELGVAAAAYLVYLWVGERQTVVDLWKLRKA